MNHLQQNMGDKPSAVLNSDRSTKLGASQNHNNTSQGHEEVAGYQSSSATHMQSVNQYRSGAMGSGHVPMTQQQMFKNMAMTHQGNKVQNNAGNMKQMSAHNLLALNNQSSDNQSQSQFEQFQNHQYVNTHMVSGPHRQRQNNYMNSQERPEVNTMNQIPEL